MPNEDPPALHQSKSTSSEHLTVKLICPLDDFKLPSSSFTSANIPEGLGGNRSEGRRRGAEEDDFEEVESGPEETTSLQELLAAATATTPNTTSSPTLGNVVPTSSPKGWSLAQLKRLKRELKALGKTDEERISYLQDRLETLKKWIQKAFHLSDPDHYAMVTDIGGTDDHSPTMMEDPSIVSPLSSSSSTSAKSTAADVAAAPVTTSAFANNTLSNKSGDEAKPVLRIKFVDDKNRANVPTTGHKATTSAKAPVRAGTGSKDLSRMMKPGAEGVNQPNSAVATAETKAKLASQTPITTFWNYIEAFFKPIEDTDLFILEDSSRFIDPAPFTIPPLGKHYEERWREQYGYECSVNVGNTSPSGKRRKLINRGDMDIEKAVKVDSIRERLLAMMVDENLTVPETEAASSSSCGGGGSSTSDMGEPCASSSSSSPLDGPALSGAGTMTGDTPSTSSPLPHSTVLSIVGPSKLELLPKDDFYNIEERIRKELTEAGLTTFVPTFDYQEDDGICAEMRILQRRLRQQVCLNHYRKRKLAALIKDRLPAQEFYNLLGEVDDQIEVSFAKKGKAASRKRPKKGSTSSGGGGSGGSVTIGEHNNSPMGSAEGSSLVETRYRLLEAFKGLIPGPTEFWATSNESLFDPTEEERVLQYARDHTAWIPIPDDPIQTLQSWSCNKGDGGAHPAFPKLSQSTVLDCDEPPLMSSI